MSEPVTQNTLRIVKVFWGLSAQLAYRRHFPAVDWLQSYSLYIDRLADWYDEEVAADWSSLRDDAMRVLQEESELEEVVRLVGVDALSFHDRLTLEAARSIREDYLHQNAFHDIDTYASLNKQYRMLKLIMNYYHEAIGALDSGVDFFDITSIPVLEKIGRAKYIEEEKINDFDAIETELRNQLTDLVADGGLDYA